jgi:hypothetical protein
MPAIHDFICPKCAHRENDLIGPATCAHCGENMQITFDGWCKLEFNQYSSNDRLDSKGYVRKFSAADDPICMAQLGMGDAKLQSYNQMTPEESTEFRQKMIANGDSPKLRREILAKYNEKLGNKYDLQD